MTQNKDTHFIHLGEKGYKSAWDYQERLFKELVDLKIQNRKLPDNLQQPVPNYLIFVYHPPVYTLGKSGDPQNLLLAESDLKTLKIDYHKINRGGDITFHGPGQIVGYPILDLDNFFTDIHKYLRMLEEAVILTLAEYGIAGGRMDGLTGVWLDFDRGEKARKICALGVRSSRWVTMHGFAFNVNTDLEYFQHIVPCGIDDKAVTSLKSELGKEVPLPEIESKLKHYISSLFHMNLV